MVKSRFWTLVSKSQFHMTANQNDSKYYPINDDFYQLSNDQKQVTLNKINI